MPEENSIFRKSTINRISSPEQLTDYLRVTNPGIWAILAAIIFLLGGLIAWAAVGTLETTTDARAVVSENTAQIISADGSAFAAGMPFYIAEEEYRIASAETDEFGRSVAYAEVSLPNGTYDAEVVVETVRPIEFLFRSGR